MKKKLIDPVEIGRKGGLSRSDAKKKAARENGKKGGAPKKKNKELV